MNFSNLFTNPAEGFLKISLIIIFINILLLLIVLLRSYIQKEIIKENGCLWTFSQV